MFAVGIGGHGWPMLVDWYWLSFLIEFFDCWCWSLVIQFPKVSLAPRLGVERCAPFGQGSKCHCAVRALGPGATTGWRCQPRRLVGSLVCWFVGWFCRGIQSFPVMTRSSCGVRTKHGVNQAKTSLLYKRTAVLIKLFIVINTFVERVSIPATRSTRQWISDILKCQWVWVYSKAGFGNIWQVPSLKDQNHKLATASGADFSCQTPSLSAEVKRCLWSKRSDILWTWPHSVQNSTKKSCVFVFWGAGPVALMGWSYWKAPFPKLQVSVFAHGDSDDSFQLTSGQNRQLYHPVDVGDCQRMYLI